MIAIQSLLFTALGSFAGLSSLIGARVYPDVAPQGVARPYSTWSEVSLVQANNMTDGSVESGGLNNYRIQVISWALTGTIARNVDEQVRLAMIAAAGFKALLIDSRAMEYEVDTKLHGVSSDFSVWLKT